MSAEEQLETLHSLSKIVTCMGIKEQIKIIKIIDPTVSISPNDTEFQLGKIFLPCVLLVSICFKYCM